MFDPQAYITQITSVFYGDHLFKAGEIHDYSGAVDYCELILKTAGETRITYGDVTFNETADRIRFLPATERRVRYISETVEEGEYVYFQFRGVGFPDEIRRMKISPQVTATLQPLYMKMYRLWSMRNPGYEHRCLALAYEIISELDRASYVPSSAAARIEPAIAYIGDHLTEEIDFSALHELCGISYTHCKSLFVKCFGLPPSRYVTSLRMKLACEQLAAGQLSVTEIASLLGYSSVAYFSRLFRREIGCTAEEYRKKAP